MFENKIMAITATVKDYLTVQNPQWMSDAPSKGYIVGCLYPIVQKPTLLKSRTKQPAKEVAA